MIQRDSPDGNGYLGFDESGESVLPPPSYYKKTGPLPVPGEATPIDKALAELRQAEQLVGQMKHARWTEILNEVSDAAFQRGQESTLPF